jgi:dTDP-4-amino-4,6-dideoxygalactose transaminase
MNFGFNVYLNERCPHRSASNWRMSDFAAAAICDHIDSVTQDSWVARQKELVGHILKHPSYGKAFKMKNNVSFPTLLSCLFLTVEVDLDMDAVANYLIRCVPSIEAKRYYQPLSSREESPLAWELFHRSICLPFHVGLTKQMLDYALENLELAIMMFSS